MFNFSHIFLLYIVLRILSCHHISFSLPVFFSLDFHDFFFFFKIQIFFHFADNCSFFNKHLWHSWHWQCSQLSKIAIESIESSGKHCNKLILHNFPMSAMFQRAVVPELDKLSFSSLLYESNIYIESVSQLRPKM